MLVVVENISKWFSGIQVLKDVSLEIEEGEVHALLGENGAGKSTLGKILAAVYPREAGSIKWKGEEVELQSPYQAQHMGISIIFQEIDLFPHLTVEENIIIGNLNFKSAFLDRKDAVSGFVGAYLDKVKLPRSIGKKLLGELSTGSMQLVALARALSFNAKLIVMDESTSSLTDDAVANLFGLIAELKRNGVSIIYVSHKLDEVFAIADRVSVLRDGAYIGTKRIAETDKDELIRMMVGRSIDQTKVSPSHATDKEMLRVSGLRTKKLKGIDFTVHAGEVFGIAGLVGAGRTEIGQAIYGIDPLLAGEVYLRGKPFAPSSPHNSIENKLGFLPEDRKVAGLMLKMSVQENISMSSLGQYSSLGFIHDRREMSHCADISKRTLLKAASPKHATSSLSGGNQQKVLFSRWVLVDPDVLFLDDPTRGVDVGAKEDIYSIIEQLAASGKAVLMTSSELPEILRCCDRIMVMNEGRCMKIVDARSTTQEEIMALAAMNVEERDEGK